MSRCTLHLTLLTSMEYRPSARLSMPAMQVNFANINGDTVLFVFPADLLQVRACQSFMPK